MFVFHFHFLSNNITKMNQNEIQILKTKHKTQKNKTKKSPLHRAAIHGNVAMVRFLLAEGANVNIQKVFFL